MELTEAFDIKSGLVVSFVGGGGKSTAMWTLARELKEAGEKVLVTTTTKIFWPEEGQADKVLLSNKCGQLKKLLAEAPGGKIITAGTTKKSEKLHGILPGQVCELKKLKNITILVEADGSARKPFKAPAEYEPVVPDCTDVIVAVVGLDILGRALTEENVHRLKQVKEITGLHEGDIIGPKAIAKVLVSPCGYRRQDIIPEGSRWIVLLNKMDKCKDEEKLRELVKILLNSPQPPARVVGSAFYRGINKIKILQYHN